MRLLQVFQDFSFVLASSATSSIFDTWSRVVVLSGSPQLYMLMDTSTLFIVSINFEFFMHECKKIN